MFDKALLISFILPMLILIIKSQRKHLQLFKRINYLKKGAEWLPRISVLSNIAYRSAEVPEDLWHCGGGGGGGGGAGDGRAVHQPGDGVLFSTVLYCTSTRLWWRSWAATLVGSASCAWRPSSWSGCVRGLELQLNFHEVSLLECWPKPNRLSVIIFASLSQFVLST